MQDKFAEYLEDCAEAGKNIKAIREDERKRFLKKACEWLDNINPDDYMDSGIFQIHTLSCNLRKAMEE